MQRASDWTCPEPRRGVLGSWDTFIGPGATPWDQVLALVPAFVSAVCLVGYAIVADLGWGVGRSLIAALLAFDLVGGMISNAAASAKRWVHRKGQTAKQHVGFVAIHLLQIGLVAFVFRGGDVTYMVVVYLYLLASSLVVVGVPLRIQRSVAALFVCGAIVLSEYFFSPTPGFEWFVPVLFIKLLMSYLTVEEPYV